MKRFSVNKGKSARRFTSLHGRVKRANVQPAPMRGGYRL